MCSDVARHNKTGSRYGISNGELVVKCLSTGLLIDIFRLLPAFVTLFVLLLNLGPAYALCHWQKIPATELFWV